ncbi:ribbon-helix-helix domain-containing protein [uncultured Novosphingobium sp.]|uniref:ribbon-helix-helix domain-containing protein n=1 Tax=uncultured Novosphingobium sp. TaxID=292277 RepID=UPI00258E40DF|nr:ribbon-helix-helix domain-containing protein [uncultured Novosphingobium sp.]
MAKRSSLLAPAVTPQAQRKVEPNEASPAPVATATTSTGRSGGKRPGKYHLGAYFDPADPTAEAFRVLAARTRRSHQDLLAEAIAELVAKYDADKQFGRT